MSLNGLVNTNSSPANDSQSCWFVVDNMQMHRRYLLRALGCTATTAVLAGALPKSAALLSAGRVPSSAKGDEAFPVTTVNHLALASANYAKSRDFYIDLFGMRVAWDDGKGCALEFGSPAAPNGLYIRPLTSGARATIGHIAFGTPNFRSRKAAMRIAMERWGLKNIHADGEMGWSCDDPAGYPLDIWVPEKDKAMFPGAAGPCRIAASPTCLAGWEAGQKNLSAIPKPGGKGFVATAYSFVILHVPDVATERDFYRDLLGMKVIYDPPAPKTSCFLSFGENTLQLRETADRGAKPYCNEFGFVVQNFDRTAVEGELRRRGLQPKTDSRLSWSITDPDGYQIGVSAAGFSQHIANDCRGSSATCPGGTAG